MAQYCHLIFVSLHLAKARPLQISTTYRPGIWYLHTAVIGHTLHNNSVVVR